MWNHRIFSLLLISALLLVAFPVLAQNQAPYNEEEVKNGGTLAGTILFKGIEPNPIFVDLKSKKNPTFCIEHTHANAKGQFVLQHVEVTNGHLKDAVVFLENVESGKPWNKESQHIDFKNCQAQPKVGVIRKPLKAETRGLLTVRNHDEGILHNPKGFSIDKNSRRIFFRKWLLNKGAEVDVTRSFRHLKKDQDTHFYIECEQHLWMSTSFHVVWNPYYDLSQTSGAYKIDQIPPGQYQLKVWHPYVGEKIIKIDIAAGETTRLDITLP